MTSVTGAFIVKKINLKSSTVKLNTVRLSAAKLSALVATSLILALRELEIVILVALATASEPLIPEDDQEDFLSYLPMIAP